MPSKLPNAILELLADARTPPKAFEITDVLADSGHFEPGDGRSDRRSAINRTNWPIAMRGDAQ